MADICLLRLFKGAFWRGERREERKERESRKGGRLKKCNFSKIRNEILVDRDELAHDEPLWLSI